MRRYLCILLLVMLLIPVVGYTEAQDDDAAALLPGKVVLADGQYTCRIELAGIPEPGDMVMAALYDEAGAEKDHREYLALEEVAVAFGDAEPSDYAEIIWRDVAQAERCRAVIRFDVIYALDWQALSKAISDMTHRYENIVEQDDVGYASGRLIVKADDELPDIAAYHPLYTVIDEENHWIIQFGRTSNAHACAEYLSSQPSVIYAEADGQVHAAADTIQ